MHFRNGEKPQCIFVQLLNRYTVVKIYKHIVFQVLFAQKCFPSMVKYMADYSKTANIWGQIFSCLGQQFL